MTSTTSADIVITAVDNGTVPAELGSSTSEEIQPQVHQVDVTQLSTCQKLQAHFISLVNPRLSNFSTPLLLALLVSIGTIAITGGFFAYTLSAEREPVQCTSTSEKIQVQGNIFQQQDFILRTKKKSTLFMVPNEKYPEFSHYPLSRYPRAPGDTFTTNDLLPKGISGANVKGENRPLDGIRVLDRDNVDWRERQLKNKDSPERDLMSDGQTSIAALATAASGRSHTMVGLIIETVGLLGKATVNVSQLSVTHQPNPGGGYYYSKVDGHSESSSTMDITTTRMCFPPAEFLMGYAPCLGTIPPGYYPDRHVGLTNEVLETTYHNAREFEVDGVTPTLSKFGFLDYYQCGPVQGSMNACDLFELKVRDGHTNLYSSNESPTGNSGNECSAEERAAAEEMAKEPCNGWKKIRGTICSVFPDESEKNPYLYMWDPSSMGVGEDVQREECEKSSSYCPCLSLAVESENWWQYPEIDSLCETRGDCLQFAVKEQTSGQEHITICPTFAPLPVYDEKDTSASQEGWDATCGLPISWLVTYRVDTQVCTPARKVGFVEALGTALAYSAYFEMAVTAVVVMVLLQTGLTRMRKSVPLMVLVGEDDSALETDPELKEVLDKMKETIQSLRSDINDLRQRVR